MMEGASMMQEWYPLLRHGVEQVVPPANNAMAVGLFSGRGEAVKVYDYLRGPAYRRSVQDAFRLTWEHFREEDAGRQSPISAEVRNL
jgi:hypothetical protein